MKVSSGRKALRDLVGGKQQVGIGDGGDQGRRLHELDGALHEGRDHALDRLRQHDAPQRLVLRHADGARAVPLAALDRQDAGAEHLGKERRRLDREGDARGHERRHLDAGDQRQREEEPEQLDQRRRGAEHLDDETAGHDAGRFRDNRSSASASPSISPKTSAVPVTLSVFTRPSANRFQLARTGVKSERRILRPRGRPDHLLHDRRGELRVEAEIGQELLVTIFASGRSRSTCRTPYRPTRRTPRRPCAPRHSRAATGPASARRSCRCRASGARPATADGTGTRRRRGRPGTPRSPRGCRGSAGCRLGRARSGAGRMQLACGTAIFTAGLLRSSHAVTARSSRASTAIE